MFAVSPGHSLSTIFFLPSLEFMIVCEHRNPFYGAMGENRSGVKNHFSALLGSDGIKVNYKQKIKYIKIQWNYYYP